MRIKKKPIVIISFTLLTLAFLILLPKSNINKKEHYNISVILRNRSSEGIGIIKNGMEQVASENNVNLNYITLINDDYINEQKEAITKEIEKGVDGLVIAPTDYEELTSIIEEVNKKVPVILFDSNINTTENISFISCDNYSLGISLAEEVIRNGNTRINVKILKSKLNSSGVNEMIEGFINEIDKTNKNYEVLEISNNEEEMNNKIQELISKNNDQVIVTFEPSILEIVGQVKKSLNNKNKNIKLRIEIYGIGSSNVVISLIEEGIINGIAMQNEFNLGYITLKTLIGEIENKKVNYGIIDSAIINLDNMYSKENQRILFPITR